MPHTCSEGHKHRFLQREAASDITESRCLRIQIEITYFFHPAAERYLAYILPIPPIPMRPMAGWSSTGSCGVTLLLGIVVFCYQARV